MRRRRTNDDTPREKRTVIPTFDPKELAKEIQDEAGRAASPLPFDPASYARIVNGHVSVIREPRDRPRSIVAAIAPAPDDASPVKPDSRATLPEGRPAATEELDLEDTIDLEDAETIGREMYGCYLASDFPDALVLAERVLQQEPDHALAKLVAERCRERLQPNPRTLNPSSVLRLKFAELERQARHIDPTSSIVLGHIDGVSDAGTIAALTGLPRAQALDRLHALLDLGVLEVISG